MILVNLDTGHILKRSIFKTDRPVLLQDFAARILKGERVVLLTENAASRLAYEIKGEK